MTQPTPAKKLKDKLLDIPHKPGVYKFLDEHGDVIYVGKAKDLRSRVSQYFGSHDIRAQLPFLMADAADIDYTVVNSELESLFLENTLIKEYMPMYNIRLRDDKNYAFIKIDFDTEIPQIIYVRKVDAPTKNTTNKYFGPFSSTKKIRQTLDIVRKIFPYCANKEVGKRPCFYYFLHRCPGVCVGQISLSEYKTQLASIALFLSGKTSDVRKNLEDQMKSAATSHKFEQAAKFRDQVNAIKILEEKQVALFSNQSAWDFVSIYTDTLTACINLFKVRDGKLIDKEDFIFENILNIPLPVRVETILQTFAENYYSQATDLPQEIFTQADLANKEIINSLLSNRAMQNGKTRLKKVVITTPFKGEKLNLIKLGSENAEQYLRKWQTTQASDIDVQKETLEALQKLLNLPTLPRRIEGYDISNTQGTNPVGSMVVTKDGRAAKTEYRKFKITVKNTPDDFSMMREMLSRRLARVAPQSDDITQIF
jgi:excinuclease ABC subunit C